jgi:amino-acid N-acetyltransferase
MHFVEDKALEMGLAELIVLSTQAFTYFESKGGFVEGTPDALPAARREKYEQDRRNSRVLVKSLNAPAPAKRDALTL